MALTRLLRRRLEATCRPLVDWDAELTKPVIGTGGGKGG